MGKPVGVYEGECVVMAYEKWMMDNEDPVNEYPIESDSKSLIEALRKDAWREEDRWMREIKKN